MWRSSRRCEEERRRLRRDLHDCLGPTLTGVSLGMRTAVRQLDRSIASGDAPPRELLGRLADEIDSVVLELKRMPAISPTPPHSTNSASSARWPSSRGKFEGDLDIHCALSTDPDPLPAAVEVAVYRIVTEAVTNVRRHAHAASCSLTMVTWATVEIDVIDDGVGFGGQVSDGVGLTAMRERAAELGGVVRFLPGTPCGTACTSSSRGSAVTPLRVAIVDDHPMFRMGLAVAIGEMEGIELVGEAEQCRSGRVPVLSTSPAWCCSTSGSAGPPAWRSTAGWPSTTRR